MTIPITTQRLVLREMVPDDWEPLLAIEAHAVVNQYQGYAPVTEEQARATVAKAIAGAAETPRTRLDFAITLHDGTFVGHGGIVRSGHELRTGELFVSLDPAHHRAGLITEAGRAFLAYAFDVLGMHRIFGDCDPRNEGSWRLMERLGMRREGHLRQNIFAKGEWCDSYVYAILAADYRAL
jgi:RimJ/RimL family protein N-acetyltransferase